MTDDLDYEIPQYLPEEPRGFSEIVECEGVKHLACLDCCLYFEPKKWLITRISVPKPIRRLGYGAKLLQQICSHADQHNITLFLEVASYNDGGLSNSQLFKWYQKFGFDWDDGISAPMSRKPIVSAIAEA